MIDNATERLKTIRETMDSEFDDWFREATELAGKLSEELKVKRVTGRQVHRANAESITPQQHFKRNLAIPFLDHLLLEMKERFNKDDRPGKAIFALLPVHVLQVGAKLGDLKNELLLWEADLDVPSSLLAELKEWVAHWTNVPRDNFPSNIVDCLAHADEDQFPNIRKLLVIGCTLPIGSAEAERSFSAFRRLNTHLRSTMSQDRLSGLALMHIHHDLNIDPDEICKLFIQKNRRRMFESCIVKQCI